MKFDISVPLLGFEDVKQVELEKIDDIFMKMQATEDEHISFTLINPATIREYEVEIPQNYKVILDLEDSSDARVFNIVTITNPTEKSIINFLAPLVINQKNGYLAQIPLDENKHRDFGLSEPIENYL